MKKLLCSLAIFLLLGATLGAMYVTENCGLVSGALAELKLEVVPKNVVGGPQQYKVTKATIEYLQKLQKDGKLVEVQNDGSLKIK